MADDSDSELSSLSSLSPAPVEDESEVELKPARNGILKFFHKIDPKQAMKTKKETSPPPRKREPSPPHEYVFADNPDIAVSVKSILSRQFLSYDAKLRGSHRPTSAHTLWQFLVFFRKRFDSVLPKSLPHFGPIELEQDIVQNPPGERVELFLCAVLGLLLNRKQDVKYVVALPPPTWPHHLGATCSSHGNHRVGHYERALNDFAINGKEFKEQWPRKWEQKSPLAGDATFHSLTPDQRVRNLSPDE